VAELEAELDLARGEADAARRTEAERRSLEERLRLTQKQESLAVLASGIAHDFNNLLMGMLGNANVVLRQLPDSSPLRYRVQSIETAALRASELTRQLRAYSGGEALVPSDVPVAELLGDMGALLGSLLPHGVELVLDTPSGLPSLCVDATQLRQVIMNLIVNAAEAIGDRPGRIHVRARFVEANRELLSRAVVNHDLPPGSYVSIEVEDSGQGMSPEVLARIFDPFYSTKRASRGLGLAAVLGIVRGHGGAIIVTSQVGRGSRFQVLLPPSAQLPVHSQAPAESGPTPSGGRVLIVEDEEGVRSTLRVSLEYSGFYVQTARHGREALRLFAERDARFDVVLLDLTMPGLSGGETLTELRRLDPKVRVVLTSGFGREESLERLGAPPPEDFIQKPYPPAELVKKLRAVMRGEPEADRRAG
jgi:nitrogen-specific signal transduction histidine kinase/CheY-like chemotaxis protein